MKKLIIAMTMVAVCFTSVFADDYGIVYEVKCALNTTKAKQVTPKKTTYTVNFGMNAKSNGTFWYMDDAIEQNATNPDNGDVGNYSNVITYVDGFKTSRGYFTETFDNLDPADKLEVVKMLSYNVSTKKTAYNYQSANKWCATVKFTIVPDTTCYKVAGTEKEVGYIVEFNGCCGNGGDTPELFWSNDNTFEDLQPINVFQYNRFNGATADKANKTELLLNIGDNVTIGGFGNYDVKNGYMSSFNGYILGLVEAPVCETCCSASINAIVHTICGDEVDCETKVIKGTVSMKYNKKLTQKFNETHN